MPPRVEPRRPRTPESGATNDQIALDGQRVIITGGAQTSGPLAYFQGRSRLDARWTRESSVDRARLRCIWARRFPNVILGAELLEYENVRAQLVSWECPRPDLRDDDSAFCAVVAARRASRAA
jgi:hypothetical protein